MPQRCSIDKITHPQPAFSVNYQNFLSKVKPCSSDQFLRTWEYLKKAINLAFEISENLEDGK